MNAAGQSTGGLAMICSASRAVAHASGLRPVLLMSKQTVFQPWAVGISSPLLFTRISTWYRLGFKNNELTLQGAEDGKTICMPT